MEPGVRKPDPFAVEGLVILDGLFQRCEIVIDLFNWKYQVSGVGESDQLFPHRDPVLRRRAEAAGEQLLELVLLGKGEQGCHSFFHLRHEIVC